MSGFGKAPNSSVRPLQNTYNTNPHRTNTSTSPQKHPQNFASHGQPTTQQTAAPQYQEFRLISTGTGSASIELPHQNIMKININPAQFNLQTLSTPLKMCRKVPDYIANPEGSGSGAVDDPTREKLDPLKVGGMKGRALPFKKRTRQMFFGVGEDGEDALHTVRKRDPDMFPWMLTDSKGENEILGSREGSQRASYMLFVVMSKEESLAQGLTNGTNGFRIQPVSKWYKFQAKPAYTTLTTEEAESKMAKMNSSSGGAGDRWMMKAKKSELEEAEKIDGIKVKKEDLEIMRKVMNKKKMKISNDMETAGKRKRRGGMKDHEEEIDFDEVISDDENPDFGIENEEEAKEAKRREFGSKIKKGYYDDDDDEDEEEEARRLARKKAAAGKSMKKVLKKIDKDNVYISDDEANPYGDEEESEDEEPVKPKVASPTLQQQPTSTSPTLQSKVKREPGDTSKPGSPPLTSKSKPGSPNLPPSSSSSNKGAGGSPSLKAGSPDLKRLKQTNGKSSPLVGGKASPSLSKKPAVIGGSTGAVRIKMKGQTPSAATSPDLEKKRKSEEEGTGGNVPGGSDLKKIKLKVGGSASPNIPPPPPSAAEIIAKKDEEDRQRRLAAKKSSASASSPSLSASSSKATSPSLKQMDQSSPRLGGKKSSGSTASPNVSGKATPTLSGASSADDSNLLTEQDIINIFKGPNPPTNLTIKDFIGILKDKISKDARNKLLIKELMKQLCVKNGDYLTLKEK